MQQENHPFAGLESDLHPALNAHESSVEADRCYFCHDAPCVTACPTGIDIPLFIRQIQTGNPSGSAKTIFDENILGGMCARVCPTETLCEQACVRQSAEKKPVKIGALQRFATDHWMQGQGHPYQRAAATGKNICVVGAGPAGLACAHRLASYGHDITILDSRQKPGGLNEYGIASYKTVENFAQQEVEFVLGIGGIDLQNDIAFGVDVTLQDALAKYDAVFLGIGIAGVNQIGVAGADLVGVQDAVDFIARLRQTTDYESMNIGRRVVVIGGGMTAIDAAVQARMLGAEDVTIAYRGSQQKMKASPYEQQLAQTHGVKIKHNVQPVRMIAAENDSAAVAGIELEYTVEKGGKLSATGETFIADADQVLVAIGQALDLSTVREFGLELSNNRIVVNADRQTSNLKVWAGGDCIDDGDDLTVWAVQDGKLAAESIHRSLTG